MLASIPAPDSMAMPTPNPTSSPSPSPASKRDQKATSSRGWFLLLLLPYLALCFPALYAHREPTLWGFPFFYWYQFAWVVLTSAILGVVYRRIRH
jgi:hypothetical protein